MKKSYTETQFGVIKRCFYHVDGPCYIVLGFSDGDFPERARRAGSTGCTKCQNFELCTQIVSVSRQCGQVLTLIDPIDSTGRLSPRELSGPTKSSTRRYRPSQPSEPSGPTKTLTRSRQQRGPRKPLRGRRRQVIYRPTCLGILPLNQR